jgi:hypothetical protein
MVAMHKPLLRAPFYADEGDGTLIHRYLEEDFVNRHLATMQQGQLQGNRAQNWRFEDRFANDKTLPWLRLPVHRSFYMVSCEVVCDAFAQPPFNPQNITSAGFVIRRRDGSRWMQSNGVAQGWQAGQNTDDDPDVYRQLRNQKLIRPRVPEPLPSGEVNYPLHAQLVSNTRADGRQRKHTLLYGYLPLSGSVLNQLIEQRSQTEYFVDSLFWPFGRSDQQPNQQLTWRRGDGHLMINGVAQPALVKLLNQLLSRYQLLDPAIAANQAINELIKTLHFYRLPALARYQQTRQTLTLLGQQCGHSSIALTLLGGVGLQTSLQALSAKQSSVPQLPYPPFKEVDDFAGQTLNADVDQALQWVNGIKVLTRQIAAQLPVSPVLYALQANIDVADASLRALQSYLSNLGNFKLQSLHEYLQSHKSQILTAAGSDEDDAAIFGYVEADWQLFIHEQQAMRMRELLFDRSTALSKDYVDGLQIPRYQQNPDDIYFIKPFVRYSDCHGNEQIVWGAQSESFRVAAPFDPEASRPQTIQMPTLADLKRGLAKGVTFLAPKDLADKFKTVSMEMPPEEKAAGGGLGMDWIISFSLPVINICAMLLLMIILNVLNLFFQWLPYAITLIPKPK